MKHEQNERRTLSVQEAARAIGVSVAHYYKQVAAGTLPGVRTGARILVPRDQLDAFLAGEWGRP